MNASGDTHEVIECYNKTATQYAAKFSDELNEKNFERIYLKGFADRQGIGNFPLLDAGCGIGHISKYLADYGFRIVGIDISPNMISKAEQLYPGITFEVSDMRAMRFPDSSFSGVLALHSIIHFDYQSIVNAFREINRVLVPGGAFLLAFHIGNEIIVNREFLGESVTIELHLLEVGKIRELLTSTDFKILEVIERYPNPEIEYPSKRAYILAIKSN